ncbi:hypothetical protein QWY75_00280 [Pontixanthobacter aestiaquae]|uniref:hypothetical protein n=1 Tax=Pontixanthobacter aestiaquae TaxID=1509367 RepID=UPI0025B4CC7D|nr:hypothetical protein [Pontixanthobacter aestiaquae]MDN3644634.1 hypothetical protein [Pontixanthobacter aestiaquae]
MTDYPRTPDGRYFVVNRKLRRLSNPELDQDDRECLVKELMQTRRQVAAANRAADEPMLKDARRKVNAAKIALAERGPVWWTDG